RKLPQVYPPILWSVGRCVRELETILMASGFLASQRASGLPRFATTGKGSFSAAKHRSRNGYNRFASPGLTGWLSEFVNLHDSDQGTCALCYGFLNLSEWTLPTWSSWPRTP